MKISNVLGLTLEEGIEFINKNYDYEIIVKETKGLKKNLGENFTDCRILRVLRIDNRVIFTTGYF